MEKISQAVEQQDVCRLDIEQSSNDLLELNQQLTHATNTMSEATHALAKNIDQEKVQAESVTIALKNITQSTNNTIQISKEVSE